MSITRELIGALGGSVRVESVYGEGSTFSVALPLQITPRPAIDAESSKEERPGGDSTAAN